MANGVTSTTISSSGTLDEVLGNKDGTTVRIGINDLSRQLMADPNFVAGDSITKQTWAQLSAIAGTRDGQRAYAENDPGTHTDPVVGGTVPNQGIFGWVAAAPGWQWLSANDVDAVTAEVETARGAAASLGARLDASDAAVAAAQGDISDLATAIGDVASTEAIVPRDPREYVPVAVWKDGPDGVAAVAVNPVTGATVFRGCEDVEEFGTLRDYHPYIYWLETKDGKACVAISRQDGRLENHGFGDHEVATVPERDYTPVLWGVIDKHGKAQLALDQNGGLRARPMRPRRLRDGRPLIDPQEFDGYLSGYVADRGATIPVKQRIDSAVATAVIDDPRPMIYLPSFGQSNASFGGTYADNPRKVTAALWPSTCFGFSRNGSVFINQGGNGVADTAVIQDLLPIQDLPSFLYPAEFITNLVFGLEASFRARGLISPGIVGMTDQYGGEPIETFLKGTQTYNNLLTHAAHANKIAALYGRRIECPVLVWTQGETPSADYGTKFDQLVTDLRTDLAAIFGPAPVIMVQQINRDDAATVESQVNLDILAVCRSRPDEVMLISPMYDGRIPDGIHGDAEARAIQGERCGEVICRHLLGEGHKTFWSAGVSRTGAVITIDYDLPPGCDMSLDAGPGQPGDGWVQPQQNHGFYYQDDSSGAAIDTVELVKVNGIISRVVITLSSDPAGAANKKLNYAQHIFETTADQWSPARGGLRTKLRNSIINEITQLTLPDAVYLRAAVEEWTLS